MSKQALMDYNCFRAHASIYKYSLKEIKLNYIKYNLGAIFRFLINFGTLMIRKKASNGAN